MSKENKSASPVQPNPDKPEIGQTGSVQPTKGQPERMPYTQLPGESAKAFAALRCYLTMGPNRSIVKAGRKLCKNRVTLEEWSVKWRWVERARTYDEDMTAKEQEAIEAEQKKMAKVWAQREQAHREKRFQLGQAMLKKAESLLNGRRKFDPAQCHRLATAGDKLVGLATGLPTDHTTISSPEGGPAVVASAGEVHVYLPTVEKLPDDPA